MSSNKQNCAELTARMLSEMRSDHYSYKITDRSVNYIYRALTKFCDEWYGGMYSIRAGQAFLGFHNDRMLSKPHWNTYKNSVTRLNHALDGDFHWKPECKKKQPYAISCFDGIIAEYEGYLAQTGKSEPDIRSRIHVLARFLAHVERSGITEVSLINAAVLYSGFEKEGSKNEFCKSVKSFLRYALRTHLLDVDLVPFVPTYKRHKPVPTTYSLSEIATILESIDRTTPAGKRNYCIILIAARLGLRSCDIVNLTFKNICADDNTIRLVQKKTGESVQFPLLPEIADALDDYIRNARPDSNESYIFVSMPHPNVSRLNPHAVYAIVSRTIKKSGINTHNKRLGAHALRSSLASQLLEEGNSYAVIQRVLGHTSPEAAKNYVKIETDRLRECALEVPCFQSSALETYFRKAGELHFETVSDI